MKAVFTLTPAESKRLIAKAVVQMPEVRAALEKAYVIIGGGTTNAFIAQELLGRDIPPARFTAGISSHGVQCHTPDEGREPFPLIFYRGQLVKKTIPEAFQDRCRETVVIKGANAVDPEGNVGVITAGLTGGTVPRILGPTTSQGLPLIVPVGLEKLVASVKDAASSVGSQSIDYSIGSPFGMFTLTNARVVTEIQALRILFDLEAKHVASGGIGGSEGSVVLVATGEESNVRGAIALLEKIKGEKPVAGWKSDCEKCEHACCFQGTKQADLPAWLQA